MRKEFKRRIDSIERHPEKLIKWEKVLSEMHNARIRNK